MNRIKQLLKQFKEHSAQFDRVAKQYGVPTTYLYFDAIRCRLLHSTDIPKYLALGMYRMSRMERKTFVNGIRTRRLEKLFNTAPNKKQLMDDKCAFNKAFSPFIRREWLYAPDCTAEDIRAFLNRYEAVMVKPPLSNMGKGVYRVFSKDVLQDADAFIGKLQAEKLMLEAFIQQHESMSSINPTSVNTIRVVTVRDAQNEVHIIGTSLRAGGKGAVVDNFHADGVQYPIDPQAGIVMGRGTKIDGTKNVIFHPATGTQVVGFQIPHWETILSTVKQAALIPEGIRYIGWDMAVTPDGCDIVEANINQGSNGMQLDGVGKYRMIMQYR